MNSRIFCIAVPLLLLGCSGQVDVCKPSAFHGPSEGRDGRIVSLEDLGEGDRRLWAKLHPQSCPGLVSLEEDNRNEGLFVVSFRRSEEGIPLQTLSIVSANGDLVQELWRGETKEASVIAVDFDKDSRKFTIYFGPLEVDPLIFVQKDNGEWIIEENGE